MPAKAAQNPAAHSEALVNVEALWSMEVEAKRKRTEMTGREGELRDALQRISELDNAALGYANNPSALPLLKQIREGLAIAKEKAASIRKEIGVMQADLDEFKRRQAGTKIEATPAVVVRHQEVLTAAAVAVESLQQRRSEIIARLDTPPAPNPVAKLLREREDLLAALALDEPRESDLASLDARIKAATAEAAPAMAEAEAAATADRQALAGIDRRLIATAEDLRRLRRAAPVLLGNLLAADMRETASRYESAAKQAAALLLRLKALDALRQAHAPAVDSGISLGTAQQAAFPMPVGDRPLLTYQSVVGNVGQHLASAKSEEVARLGSLGVVIQ